MFGKNLVAELKMPKPGIERTHHPSNPEDGTMALGRRRVYLSPYGMSFTGHME